MPPKPAPTTIASKFLEASIIYPIYKVASLNISNVASIGKSC
jgi:hypothetical protein